jgi:tape measure domain-containing protein
VSEVGSAFVTIIPSFRGFGRALSREITSEVATVGTNAGRDVGNRFNEGFSSAAGRIKETVTRGIMAAGAAIGVGAGWGLRIASENEQAMISFETMLGSAEAAGGFLKDLQRFAATTPFEFPELQTAASSLISVGISADKVVPIMTSLGNATSGMGTGAEGVKRATVALQQMNAAGRITAEDLNQLRDAGVPVFDLLSAATGKSTAQIAEMASKGKLGRQELDQLMSALETGAGLERFSGLMEKQSQSLSGMISTFKDTLGMGLANLVQPYLPNLKTGLGMVSGLIATAFERIPGIIQNVGVFLAPIIDAFRTMIPAAVAVARPYMNEAFTGLRIALGVVRVVLVGFLAALTGVFRFIANNRTLVETIVVGLGAFAAVIGVIVAAMKVWRAITLLYTAAQIALNIAMLMNPVGLVIAAIVGLVAAIVVLWMRSETFREIVIGVWTAVRDWVVGAAKAIGKWVTTTWDRLVDATASFARSVIHWFTEFKDGAVERTRALITFVSELPGRLLTAIGMLGTLLVNKGRELLDGLQNGISGAVGSAITALSSAISSVVSGIGSLGTRLYSAGQDLLQGLIDGIKAKVSGAVTAVTDAVSSVISGAKNLLGIGSPSRVFLSLGRETVAGLTLGIERDARAPADAARTMAAGAALAARTATAALPARGTLPGAATGALTAPGVPSVRVYIGDRELTDLVRVEIDSVNAATARSLIYGRAL